MTKVVEFSPVFVACEQAEWRIDRLEKAWVAMVAQGVERRRVLSLHDHEGLLTVTWLSAWTLAERTAAQSAWEAVDEENVEHEVTTCKHCIETRKS